LEIVEDLAGSFLEGVQARQLRGEAGLAREAVPSGPDAYARPREAEAFPRDGDEAVRGGVLLGVVRHVDAAEQALQGLSVARVHDVHALYERLAGRDLFPFYPTGV
jgi:hypothetical protein